jgi:hypothetical protein
MIIVTGKVQPGRKECENMINKTPKSKKCRSN